MSVFRPQENNSDNLLSKENNSVTLTWQDIDHFASNLAKQILDYRAFKTIVAVGRGGWIPATMISHFLGIRETIPVVAFGYIRKEAKDPTQPVDIIFSSNIRTLAYRADVLVVDDICDTGDTFKALNRWMPCATYVALATKPRGVAHCKFSSVTFEQASWITFPWEKDSIV